jgi:4-amino-4-deoxy-L-arabinose transferase-like glycosyltransferase
VAGLTVAGLLIAVGLMVLVTRYTDLDVGPRGFLATALLVVGLGLVASAVTRARAPRGGLIALGSVLSLALLFTSAVPWNEHGGGGVGDRHYRPATAEAVPQVYRLGAGDMDVDLSRIDVTDLDEPIELRIEHGLGDLDVEVPRDADVRIAVENGIGETDLFGQSDDGYFRAPGGDGEPEILLTIHHGAGDLEVSRA